LPASWPASAADAGQRRAPNPEFEALGGRYVSRDELFAASDVISLHCPLTEATRYLVNAQTLASTKPGCILVNTSRGGLVDTEAAIAAFKSGQLRGLAIDVYEQEASLFFQDLSDPSPTT
jgi:D-lactate dehydrogenase